MDASKRVQASTLGITRRSFVTGALAALAVAAGGACMAGWPMREAQAAQGGSYTVRVSKGYLALRTWPSYDASNEIGSLNTGDVVTLQYVNDDTYWYVYAPRLGASGYVNKNYLMGSDAQYTVCVAKGYLALRNAKAYDERNEVGALYTGDNVQVQDTSDPTYWYVYAPRLGCSGYVNKDYLVGGPVVCNTYMVVVQKGYLALRYEKAYDERNEVGALYTGDTVQVRDTSDPTYWYVYSPTYGRSGYVNKNYLAGATTSIVGSTYSVHVQKGYLALRSWKEYTVANEIGALYPGDVVQVQRFEDGGYWYVYAPSIGAYGYVNKDYLW